MKLIVRKNTTRALLNRLLRISFGVRMTRSRMLEYEKFNPEKGRFQTQKLDSPCVTIRANFKNKTVITVKAAVGSRFLQRI